MNKKPIYPILSITLAACLLAAGSVYAEPASEPETAVAKTAPELAEIRTIGEESENAVRFEFVNETGDDITWLSIQVDDGKDREEPQIRQMQEVLIEQGYLDDVADGIIGPKTREAILAVREENGLSQEAIMDAELLKLLGIGDGNVLPENEVIKNDEQVIVFYEEDAEEDGEAVENAFAVNKEYTAAFRLAKDEKTEYVLHTLPVDETVITIRLEEEIPYVEYQAAGTDNVISTLETEKTIREPAPAAPAVQEYQDYGNYDDASYDDYVYDYEYTDSYTEEPAVYEEPAADVTYGVDGCLDDDALLNP